jgi:Domain of unknown function (DUF6249)
MSPDIMALMVPNLAIVLGVGVAFWSIYWDHQKKRLQYEERRLMIERGLTPPPELPSKPKNATTPEDCLRRGTIMFFLGIGFAIAYFVVQWTGPARPAWLLGVAAAIVGLLGVGNLVYYAIARRRTLDTAGSSI